MAGLVERAPDGPPAARTDDVLTVAEAVALLRPAPWRRLVVLGDSVAAGVREPVDGFRDLGFPDQVGEALAAAHPPGETAFLNLGTPHARIADVAERQLARAIGVRPDLAMVIAGGNDAFGRDWDAERARRALGDLCGAVAAAGATVVTVGLFDVARSGLFDPRHAAPVAARFDELDVVTRAVSAEVGGIHVDTRAHPRAADPAIFSSDRIHANARGHALAFAATVQALAAGPRATAA